MSTTRNQSPVHKQLTYRTLGAASALLLAVAPFATAQATLTSGPASDVAAANLHLDLPDSPGVLFSSSSSSTDAATNSADPSDASFGQTPTAPQRAKHALHLQMVVKPDEIADPMTVSDKIEGGLKDSVSLFSALGWLFSAGYEQLTNGSPNYGTNSEAFGKRFGAAVARDTSETIFSESLFAPLFHQDPRYYIMGPGHPFFKRLVYSGTRTIITKNDNGHLAPNFSLIAGNAAGSALTIVYYPAINTTSTQVLETLGTSLGGSAVGYVVDEFIVDVLIDLHLKKRQPQP